MKELLQFLTALANPKEAYLSVDRGTNDVAELIVTYNTHTDEYLKERTVELDQLLEENTAQLRLQATDTSNIWDVVVISQGTINDSFTIFNVNIHHLAINEIDDYLESSQQVKLAFKHNKKHTLNTLFNLQTAELPEESPFLNMPIDLVNATIESMKKTEDQEKG